MKILLLGAKGQLGIELHKVLTKLGDVFALTRKELDLTDILNALKQKLEIIRPDLIVNSSAYTAVDKGRN
jgi:dTDP-4-dehydrorhamnose reductase